jgi:hypothetical protein
MWIGRNPILHSSFCIHHYREVPAHLVVATVFKIAVPSVNRPAGGFDSHALPFIFLGKCEISLIKESRQYFAGA